MRPRPHPLRLLAVAVPVLLSAVVRAQVPGGTSGAQSLVQAEPEPAAPTAPFTVLDDVEGDRIDLSFAPVNPMVLAPSGALFAVNTHGSTVVRFDDLSGVPAATFRVPWGPVSIAHWVSAQDGHEELLVVSRGTYALTRLDPATGDLLGYLALPAEPAGVALDSARGHLFVACSALDVVVEIDLAKNAIHDRFEVDTARHLAFLSMEPNGSVLVAPMISGNDSLVERGGVLGDVPAGARGILDLDDPAVAVTGLPDHDLFRIRPSRKPFGGTIEVVATGLGTNLYAHGIHPDTGRLWILNTEANNKDPNRQSEAAVRGEIVFDRVTITDLPPPGGSPATKADHTFLQLDDSDRSTPEIDYAPGFSIGKPYGLAFSEGGNAFVVGALTDNVRVLDEDGNDAHQWNLTPGAIPRGVLFVEGLNLVAVYCWGTNEIEVYSVATGATPLIARLDLGYDPAPADVQAGRELFYDGHDSLHENASCESCHLEGGSDFLAWNLSDLPADDKGPMVTQNLRGIEPLAPYHWRGERDFTVFNGAFDGLLGGQELDLAPGGDFDRLRSFVFQLQNPANPYEHEDRVVSDAQTSGFNPGQLPFPGQASAVRGQDLWFQKPLVAQTTCDSCHTLPTGSLNDYFPDSFPDQGPRTSFIAPGFNGIWRKEQKTRVDVQLAGATSTERRPPLGAGTSHAGTVSGVYEFIDTPHPKFRVKDHADIALFVHQLDSGLAPAVHRGALLAAGSLDGLAEVTQYLLPQTLQGNCDLAVFGTVDLGAGPRALAWYWDRGLQAFAPSDSTVAPVGLGFFQAQAFAGKGRNLFVGLPLGMARRWGVDADADELFDLDELAQGTQATNPDTDADGFLDGTEVRYGSDPTDAASQPVLNKPRFVRREVVYTTARVAKLVFETLEPSRLQVDYRLNGGALQVATPAGLQRLHTVILTDLAPSHLPSGLVNVYTGKVHAFDEAGNEEVVNLPAFSTLPFADAFADGLGGKPVEESVVGELNLLSSVPAPGGGFTLEYEARIDHMKLTPTTPLPNHVVVARVLLQPAGATQFERVDDFVLEGAAAAPVVLLYPFGVGPPGAAVYSALGPFAIGTPSDSGGYSRVKVTLPNAQAGDQVRIAIETVGRIDPATWDPASWDTSFPKLEEQGVYYYPVTPAPYRASAPVTL